MTSLLSTVRKTAPEIAVFIRKVAELDTEAWLEASLPAVHNLPAPAVMARQMVSLRDAVLVLLRGERDQAIEYVSKTPPHLAPIDPGAMAALPIEAAVTYHAWLEGLVRALEPGKAALADLLGEHLREATGTGGQAGLKPAGGRAPGFAPLGEKEAVALRERLKPLGASTNPEARALYGAVAARAGSPALQAAVLRDGAGRVVAAATFTTKGLLSIRHLGALEALVPGSGAQMVRELAGLAAENEQGMEVMPTPESAPVFVDLGFVPLRDGRYVLGAQSALTLAQAASGSLPAWAAPGWLEGPEGVFELETEEAVRKAIAPLPADGSLPFGSGVINLRGKDRTLHAVAHYTLPREGKDLVITSLWVSPSAPASTGRRILRRLAAEASKRGLGLVAAPAENVVDLYTRMGMAKPSATFWLSPTESTAVATGLTRGATFLGEISWELAVAGAAEWLARDVIPGIVDEVSATTYQQLIDTLVDGVNRGQGTNDLIARIRALDETTFGLARAERIARTEVLAALSAGAQQIAIDAGATIKRWSSRLMPNTRAWHREAHGQEVSIKEPFVVANRKGQPEKMMFPRDPSLGAGPDNRINCVCSSLEMKIGVSDEASYDQHGLAGDGKAPGPVVATSPEPIQKRGRSSLEDLRAFVAVSKSRPANIRRLTRR